MTRDSLLDWMQRAIKTVKDTTGERISLKDLTVLAPKNDPFRVGTPRDHVEGQWLRDQMAALGIGNLHFRGIHYRLIGVIKPDGTPYANDVKTWEWLQAGPGKAARWLRYIAFERIIDARNDSPTMIIRETRTPSSSIPVGVDVTIPDAGDYDPTVEVADWIGCQAYRLAIFGEKSSLRPIVEPISDRFNTDLFLPTGELSDTMIYALAKAVHEDGRPCVVFYLSDCDPSGWQMGISLARKLQALKILFFKDIDVRVYRVALTPTQVLALGLPSTPLKDITKEKRGDAWTDAFGVEQTEIDAVPPALLTNLLTEAIEPWFDGDLDDNVEMARDDWQTEAQRILEDAIDADALAAHRDTVSAALDEIEGTLRGLDESLEALIPDELELPEMDVPEPEYDDLYGHGTIGVEPVDDDLRDGLLFHSRWSFGEGTSHLKAVRAYENGDSDEDDE